MLVLVLLRVHVSRVSLSSRSNGLAGACFRLGFYSFPQPRLPLNLVETHISTVDIHAEMTFDDDIGPDGVHPNQPGDDVIAAVFYNGIKKLYP